jgi:peptidoglycan/LPS O-acetylase OafA/YrhL
VSLALFWFVATQLGLGGSLYFRVTTGQSLEMHGLYGLIAFFLLLPAVFAEDVRSLPRLVLGNRVVAWIGLISYGIFLWHHPIALKLTSADHQSLFGSARMLGITGATFLIATACATTSYYLIERPILRYKDRPFGRRRRQAAAPAASAGSGRTG